MHFGVCGKFGPFVGIVFDSLLKLLHYRVGLDSTEWLTDFQQRKKPEQIAGDEDGPATDAEEEEKSETDDEDPTSEEDVAIKCDGPRHDPSFHSGTPQWRKGSI